MLEQSSGSIANKFYAGIGSREIPPGIEPMIEECCILLEKFGFILRSGGAPGADFMFEKYTKGEKEIFLPWKGFNNNTSPLYLDSLNSNIINSATDIAINHHPAWERLSEAGKKLMTRNTFQVLGKNLNSPVKFLVCWTKGGTINGGTGQAMRIAKGLKIPIFNLYDKEILYKIKLHIHNIC